MALTTTAPMVRAFIDSTLLSANSILASPHLRSPDIFARP
jgi:hypothetical protein